MAELIGFITGCVMFGSAFGGILGLALPGSGPLLLECIIGMICGAIGTLLVVVLVGGVIGIGSGVAQLLG